MGEGPTVATSAARSRDFVERPGDPGLHLDAPRGELGVEEVVVVGGRWRDFPGTHSQSSSQRWSPWRPRRSSRRSWNIPTRLWAVARRSEYREGPSWRPSGETRSTWAAMRLPSTMMCRLLRATFSRSETDAGVVDAAEPGVPVEPVARLEVPEERDRVLDGGRRPVGVVGRRAATLQLRLDGGVVVVH